MDPWGALAIRITVEVLEQRANTQIVSSPLPFLRRRRRGQWTIRSTIVAQGYRAEYHGKPVGSRDRAGDRQAFEIRADHIEGLRQEAERTAETDIGGIDADLRTPAAIEIGKGRTMKHQPVVDLRHPVVGAHQRVEQPVPIPRQQKGSPNVGFDVPIKKLIGKSIERLLPVEAEMSRREGPARHTGQQVDFVKQRAVFPLGPDVNIPHSAQHTETESCRTLAAAGKGHHHQVAFSAAAAVHVEQAIFGVPGSRLQRFVHLCGQRAAAGEQQRRDNCKDCPFAHAPNAGAHARAFRDRRRALIAGSHP